MKRFFQKTLSARRILSACLTIFMVVGLAACDEGPQKKAGAKRSAPAHLVEVVAVVTETLSVETQRTGSLQARRSVRLFNQEEGRIEAITVNQGDRVAKGDVLLRLDRRLLQAELAKAAASLKQTADDLKRAKELSRRKVTTQERLDKAGTALSVAQAEEQLIRTRLGYGVIKAPFDGVITQRLAEPGDVAPRNTHLLSLIDPQTLYMKVTVSELLLPSLAVGGQASVSIDALGPATWTARIERIHPTVDPRTRQGTVEVALAPVPDGARAGQLARVTLKTAPAARRVMPFSALRHDRDGAYAFVVGGDGKAAVKRIRVGERLHEKVEVLDGLNDGARVVVRGFLGLGAGKAVRVSGASTDTGGHVAKP